jgi:Zn-finger nucleic acid-binding protein
MEHRTRLPVEAADRCRGVRADHGEVDRVEDILSRRRVDLVPVSSDLVRSARRVS